MAWMETVPRLFQAPPRDATPLARERTIAVVQAWNRPEAAAETLLDRLRPHATGWVLALRPIEQSWEPRAVPARGPRR